LYHHGEASLYGTIVNMAQIFVGSNNLNLLLPNGNFGSRRLGGKDAASPRYIFTQLNGLTGLIFRKDDECIYRHVDENGTQAEPERYAPIFPFALVNGAEGIGTGFSTFIPPYNPKDIIKNLKLLINGDEPEEMVPWFRGFRGDVKVLANGKIQTSGIHEIIDDKTVKITELPIGFWTESYKEFLDSVDVNSKSISKNKFVESYKNNSGNNKIEFIITFVDDQMQQMIKSNTLEKHLKLTNTISLTNMYLHNSKGKITKYVSVDEIISEFYKYRLSVYADRKKHVIKVYENELKIIEGKVRFIECVLSKKIKIEKKR
jgi:DNA topoisomerase-2